MSGDNQARTRSAADAVFYVVLGLIFVTGTIYAFAKPDGHDLRTNGLFRLDVVGILVATGVTLALYSFLYGDNPFFRAAEHLYVGIGLGYQLVLVWFDYIKPEAYTQLIKYALRPDVPGRPTWELLPALFLSALMLARFIPQLGWVSRIPVAGIVGFTAGTQVPSFIQANVLQQVEQTVKPLTAGAGLLPLLGDVVILVGVVTVLLYFFFSVEHRGAIGVGSRVGMWFLMVAFGASFGYTVMGRMALLVGRIHFLLEEWLRIPLKIPLG